jgi:alkylation response protein AidB-like acyl-CoA dehydrogenase
LLAERPSVQMLVAENAIDLSAMRAVFDRAGVLIDHYFCEHQASIGAAAVQDVFTEVQSAKTFVHLAAIRTVDRAMAIAGGAGYMSRHPLSRLYRDVRAGPFMHSLGVSAAQEFIGRSVLGLDPAA